LRYIYFFAVNKVSAGCHRPATSSYDSESADNQLPVLISSPAQRDYVRSLAKATTLASLEPKCHMQQLLVVDGRLPPPSAMRS